MRVFGELTALGERVVKLGRIWGVGRGGAITVITAVGEEQDKDGAITIPWQVVGGGDLHRRQADSLSRSGETLEQVVGHDIVEYQEEELVCEHSPFSITYFVL